MTTEIVVEKTAEDVASRSLKVTVPLERGQAAEDKALKYYPKRARLPGFRQGKAPEAVVRRRLGDAIRQSALEEVVRDGCGRPDGRCNDAEGCSASTGSPGGIIM